MHKLYSDTNVQENCNNLCTYVVMHANVHTQNHILHLCLSLLLNHACTVVERTLGVSFWGRYYYSMDGGVCE